MKGKEGIDGRYRERVCKGELQAGSASAETAPLLWINMRTPAWALGKVVDIFC